MALPPGIITKTLTISPGVGAGGVRTSLEVLISLTPSSVVWQATGETILSMLPMVRTDNPTVSAVLALPVINQPGLRDANQIPNPDFFYTITVRYLLNGRKTGSTLVKYYKPLLDSPAIEDFDFITVITDPVNRGPRGIEGKSAYAIAVEAGFIGSKEAWLSSLISGGVPGYTHQQSLPSDTWVITHNLGYSPGGIALFDSSNREFKAQITYVNQNTLIANMVGAQSGTANIS